MKDLTKEELETLKRILLTHINEADEILADMKDDCDKEEMSKFYSIVSSIYKKLF